MRRLRQWFADHRTVLGYLILMGSVAFAVAVSYRAIDRVQSESNKTRCQIVALVETFTENSQRSARATIASPTATKAQKDAATANLAQVIAALHVTQDKLGNPTGDACTIAQ